MEKSLWKKHVEDVEKNGFEKAAPISRLIWYCEVGKIDQHASEDLLEIARMIEFLRGLYEPAKCGHLYKFQFQFGDGSFGCAICGEKQ